MRELQVAVLGRFELTGGNGPIDLTSKKLIGLLAFLACTTPQPQGREKLMALLWGSHFEVQARQNLRQALTRLRRVLGADALISNGGTVSLDPDAIGCDVMRFEALVRHGSRDSLAEAVDLYRDRLLADIAIPEQAWTEWLDVQRQRLESLALDSMVKLGACELQSGDAEGALRAAHRAMDVDNLREDAHRLAIHALAASGRRVEALKDYEHLFALLKRELDVPPDSATRKLVKEIRGESGLQQPSRTHAAPEVSVTDRRMRDRHASGSEDRGRTDLKEVTCPLHDLRTASGLGAGALPPKLAPQPGQATVALRPRLRLAMAVAGIMLFLVGVGVVTSGRVWEAQLETASLERMAFPLPQKPSIAVLPFANLSSGAAQDSMGEGLTDGLVNALARNPSMFVIAHSSTSAYAGQSAAAKRAAEELGVRYIVEGSIRRAGSRVRVATQLVDALSGSVLWSERYQRTTDDLLALEEEITARIARSLDVRINHGTEQSSGGTRKVDASTAYLQGRNEYLKFTAPGNARARRHYLRALEVDPNYAEAMVALASTYFIEMVGAPAEDWGSALAKIAELQDQAARIAPGMPRLFELRSLLAVTRGDYNLALTEAEAMAALDPNGAESHYVVGRMYFFTGQYERAIDSLRTAERINPHNRASYSSHLAFSHLALGRIDVAISVLEAVVERWPDFSPGHAYLVIMYQLAGRASEARQHVALLSGVAPQITMLAIQRRFSPVQDRPLRDRIIEAARQAGIPD
ncbi:MAG TPA: BTAD domain-containing putative transcriptional regulator [Propylenella sp.]